MKIGKYKSPSGEEHSVVQVDEENKRVECDYGTHCHWWDESEYSTWECIEPTEVQPTQPDPALEPVKEKKKPGRKKKIE